MKKIVLNLSDTTYEKLRLETIEQKKDVHTIIKERIFSKPFSQYVEEAFEEWESQELCKLLKD
jgi:hypothetical protein